MTSSAWAQGDDRHLIRRAMQAPLLSREEERTLATRWRKDHCEESLAKLTMCYLRLVVSASARYRHYGLPISDLIQEGTVGLMEAAARFEPDRDVRFSTYASWWIRAAIQDFVLRNWSIVRTGTTAAHKALFFNLKRLKARISGATDKPLSVEEKRRIADDLGVKLRDVDTMEGRLSGQDRSLNAPMSDDNTQEWQDVLVSTATGPEGSVLDQSTAKRRREIIAAAMGELTPRESLIIRRRRLSDEGVTLVCLGDELGISKERVRQLEAQALDKLRTAILARVDKAEAQDFELGLV